MLRLSDQSMYLLGRRDYNEGSRINSKTVIFVRFFIEVKQEYFK